MVRSGRAASRTTPFLTDALLDLMIALRRDKAAVLALMEVLGDADAGRAVMRERVSAGIVAILRTASPRLTGERRGAGAAVVTHLPRGVSRLSNASGASEPWLAEPRLALSLYLADVPA